ncbi:MAG: tRNA lysidine(34) synthetase TilS [Bacteroidales bacterium]|nr:tRNA lysidine(34) synthetase TilS [Bacteroidales bacterium]MBR5862694.1 tRNA lysidine(34) synthetase TilS [Bacteroidales bacterium]
MLNRFKHIVEEMRGLIDDSRSASFLLAVSGGVDSMCLADMWVRCFGAETCSLAHCNFNLRGEDSDGDETLVTDWAKANGVRLHKVSFDTLQYASENGVSIEMAARELRYRWFGELCLEHGYKAVVVAHHADDNAETMVLNMVRGTGLKGLSGMKPVSPLPLSRHCEERSPLRHCEERSPLRHCEERSDVAILRPLLTFTRKQIEGHAFAWKVPYREDKTNASVEYRRNSIRHEVFPLFERMNPSYVRTFNREMAYFKDASDIVEDWCRAHVAMVVDDTSHVCVSISSLLSIPQWRYLLYYILEPYGFNSATLESLESLLMSDRTVSGKRFESEDYVLLTERDTLEIYRKTDESLLADLSEEPFMVARIPGIYHVNGTRIVVETLTWTPDMSPKQPEGSVILDAAKLRFPFVLRKWRSGDWMIPLGMKGKKKISDLFTDLKYSHMQKERAVILVDMTENLAEQQHVAGVAGVRIDDSYKVTDSTETIIRITIS